MEECDNSTVGKIEAWNVEALVEIPLRREKIGKMEEWKRGRMR